MHLFRLQQDQVFHNVAMVFHATHVFPQGALHPVGTSFHRDIYLSVDGCVVVLCVSLYSSAHATLPASQLDNIHSRTSLAVAPSFHGVTLRAD